MVPEIVYETPKEISTNNVSGFNNFYQTHDNTRPGSRSQRPNSRQNKMSNTAKRSKLSSIIDFKGILESSSRNGHELVVNQI